MGIVGYKQIMEVDTASTLPVPANTGDIAFADDTKRHYMFSSGSWFQIPNSNEMASVRYWENGTFKNGTPMTGDIIIFTDTTTTSGGSATFYPTSNHLSTGTALCSYLSANSFQPNYRDSSGVYAPGAVTVGGTFKTIGQAFAKQQFTGVVVLSLNVLGSASNVAIPDGVTVMATWWGVSI